MALDILSTIWGFYKILATVVSMVAIVILIYAVYGLYRQRTAVKQKLAKIGTWRSVREEKHTRWEKIEQYLKSEHPSDWKIAVLEADSMLDDIIKHMGYKGETMGERLKQIQAKDFPFLDEAWNAHKVRNQIAHRGSEYPITRTEAEDTIDKYNRIFVALKYL